MHAFYKNTHNKWIKFQESHQHMPSACSTNKKWYWTVCETNIKIAITLLSII